MSKQSEEKHNENLAREDNSLTPLNELRYLIDYSFLLKPQRNTNDGKKEILVKNAVFSEKRTLFLAGISFHFRPFVFHYCFR